jgi:hypothetical protein
MVNVVMYRSVKVSTNKLHTQNVFPNPSKFTLYSASAGLMDQDLLPCSGPMRALIARDYSKRAVQPKCEVQGAKCTVQT